MPRKSSSGQVAGAGREIRVTVPPRMHALIAASARAHFQTLKGWMVEAASVRLKAERDEKERR